MKYFLLLLSVLIINISAASAQDYDYDEIQTVLVAKQEADIASPVSGRVLQLPFFEGDIFKQDDVLVLYDCTIEKAQYAQAKARHDAAAGLLSARKKLNELNTVSKLELLRAEAETQQAKAEVEEYEARVARCEVLAPFDGRITARNANPYETTEAGQPLLSIASLDRLQAQLLVPSKWLGWVAVGSKISVTIQENGQVYSAHIARIGGAVDPVSQSIQLIAELDDDHQELLPGMTGVATFTKPAP